MQDAKLKTAVLGLDDYGLLFLDAIANSKHLQLSALADTDANLAEKIAARFECDFYDDYRQLVIQNQFDCLIVNEAIHLCAEYVKAAIKKKINILKVTPPARNFEEAAELFRLAKEQQINFAAVNPFRFTQSFADFNTYIKTQKPEYIFLVSAVVAVDEKPKHSWQTDPKLAGGGVLLQNAYQIIDQICLNLPIPQQTYALKTNTAHDRQQRLYLTEDTAIVSIKFSDTCSANITASNQIRPAQQTITVYAKDKILTVSQVQFTVTDHTGNVELYQEYDYNLQTCIEKQLANFALSITKPNDNKLICSAADNLKAMAVIEAAYLSSRTGFPEQPEKILNIEQIDPTTLWPII